MSYRREWRKEWGRRGRTGRNELLREVDKRIRSGEGEEGKGGKSN